MAQIVTSVKNTFVNAEVVSLSCVTLGSKACRPSTSTPARVSLDAAESENSHVCWAHGLEEFLLLPHDDDDYSSMHIHPGPSPFDMDVECMLDCCGMETDDDDDFCGLSDSQLKDTATYEEMQDDSASVLAYHGLTYGAHLPDDNDRTSSAQHQPCLSTAPMTPNESAQHQFSTSPISAREEQIDSCRKSYSVKALARVPSNAKREETRVEEERTTVMLKNIPLRYTNSRLMRTMASEGFASMYDFIYVPMAAARTSKGHAFVNCVSPSIAQRFVTAFNGFSRWSTASKNVCQAVWAKQHQGLHASIDHYRNSTVMGKSVPKDYKPRMFKNGEEMPFPPPNRTPSTATLRVGQPRTTNGHHVLPI